MLSEETLSLNLAALEQAQGMRPRFAALDAAATRAVPHGGDIRIEIRGGDEWVPLWDTDPIAEARRQVAAAGETTTIFVIGGGVGHLLDVIEQRRTGAKVILLEPDPGIAVLLLARRDWRRWFAEGRLRVLTGPDYAGASACAGQVSGDAPAAVIVNTVMETHRPDEIKRAKAVAASIQEGAAANAAARRQFAGRYLLQTLRNVHVIGREGDAAALDGAFHGRPAVLVAAGPSLDRTVSALLPYQDRIAIIGSDTTLRPMLAAGVRPHLMVGLDPAEVNATHLHGARDPSGIYLAGEGSLHPNAFIDFADRTFVFQVSNHHPWPWLAAQGLRRGQLRAWGSVATAALDLALRAGCNPIIFTGHDLAYTDDRPYCDNTVFHEGWRAHLAHNTGDIRHYEEQMINWRPLVETTDVNGRPVKTTAPLIAFRDWIAEQTTLTTDRTFINATGGGILRGPRLEPLPLAAALERHAGAASSAGPVRDTLAACHARRNGAIQLSTPPDDVIAQWIAFTANTVTREEVLAALESA